jgi:hypothetical protein
MNFTRLSVLGAFLTATSLAIVSACSSSSSNNGTTTNKDAGKDTGSGTGTGSGSGTGTGSGSGTGTGSGSGTGTGTGSGSGTGTGTGSGSGACAITPGTYEVTNTIADGGTASAACPPPNSPVTYPSPPVDSGMSDGNIPDSGIACTTTTNGCSTTTTCMGLVSGMYQDNTTLTESVTNGIPSGSFSSSITYPDGAPLTPACAYTFVWVPSDGGADQ